MKTPIHFILAALLALLATAPFARAQERDLEAAVKATFLTRFAAFVDWPAASFADPAAPLVICVAGDAALAALVETAAQGQHAGAHPIAVHRQTPQHVSAQCHVLYAGGSRQEVAQMLAAVRGQAVLTVTDERYGDMRGMIHFVRDSDRVRFHVNRDAANAAGLGVSARLLSVALSVRSRRSS